MAEDFSRVGTIESVLSGIASGLIAIPKGAFSLGATLMDLGAGTNKAAEVEQFFVEALEQVKLEKAKKLEAEKQQAQQLAMAQQMMASPAADPQKLANAAATSQQLQEEPLPPEQ